MKYIIFTLSILLFLSSCQQEDLSQVDDFYHLRIEQADIPVWVRGNAASGNFMIFLQGGPGLASMDIPGLDLMGWNETVEKEHAIVYYDARGTGNNQGSFDTASLTLTQYIADLEAVVSLIEQEYDNPNIFMLGHSWGGFLGSLFLFEESRQDHVKGWINLDGAHVFNDSIEAYYRMAWFKDVARDFLAQGIDTSKWSEALAWAETNPDISERENSKTFYDYIGFPGQGVIPEENFSISAGEVLHLLFAYSYNAIPGFFTQHPTGRYLTNASEGMDLRADLAKIQIPSLYLYGKYDDIVPPQQGQDAFENLGTPEADKSFLILQGSGHNPMLNEPELMNQTIIDFLSKYGK